MTVETYKTSTTQFELNRVAVGDCRKLILDLPDDSIDVVVTSPPYWGQRTSEGTGVEDDPREYSAALVDIFEALLPKLSEKATMWINIGDAYNTPVNWRSTDHTYSTLGSDKSGLDPENSAYAKPRHKRRAFIEKDEGWLSYGNLLALPYRLITALSDVGYLFRGEVIWQKANAMPEGRCRRPHRKHEAIYVLAKSEQHDFRTKPPVPSIWTFPNEKIDGKRHFSRFPTALPTHCIDASTTEHHGKLVFDPFAGSGTTGLAALQLGASFVGFEIDEEQAAAANARLLGVEASQCLLENDSGTRG